MGQAFRRATGRIASSTVDTTPSAASKLGKPVEKRPPVVPVKQSPSNEVTPDSEGVSSVKEENVLEDRDPQYDVMLNRMVGRIQTKPGGKLEMGEASVVDKYKRPLPKLRNTTPDYGKYEEKPAPPGTLNVAQLRQIILLHQGKSNDHNGPMDIPQIAERFRIDVAQVQSILGSVALPPVDESKRKNYQE
ncbi:hypothetical protein ACJIZ3_014137 [Penstemon smallii]|uniref:Uncharacterized protein n=1 Tax=Penstemon smallii TaxID=265156 RepID=A0ABD3RIV4_9LAMI